MTNFRRTHIDWEIKVVVKNRFAEPVKTMTLDEWFEENLPGDDQEEERIAIRFAMDAQFEARDSNGDLIVLERVVDGLEPR